MGEITFEGGLNEQDSTAVNPQECVEGYNFEIQNSNTHLQPRPPFERQASLPFDISTASYVSKSFLVVEDPQTSSIFIGNNGTKLYVGTDSFEAVFQYSLNVAWDISTASYDSKNFDLGGEVVGSPQGLIFKPDGLSMYVVDLNTTKVYQYTLETAWDVSTASYSLKSFDVSNEAPSPQSLYFSDDGDIMYIVGATLDKVYQYTLETAWDVSTAEYSSKSFDATDEGFELEAIGFKNDGTVMLLLQGISNNVFQYSLSTAWDVSTASYTSQSFDFSNEESLPVDFFLRPDSLDLYMVGQTNDTIYQYKSSNSAINGFVQLITSTGVKHTLVQGSSKVYDWNGSATFTLKDTLSANSRLRGVNWTLGDYSVVVDILKNTVVKKWDGTSFTTLTTGLGTSLKAKYAVVYLGRVWLFNVESGVDTPHLILASAFENPESYDTSERAVSGTFSTGLEAFYITVPNLKPINGVALFYDTLVISTVDGVLYKLVGSDADTFQILPYYAGSSAVGTETFANIGNDVVYMRQSVIESLRTTDTSGDVATDDLSKWIRPTVEGLTDAITVYDRDRQKVYFFIGNNKVLVLFKNKIDSGFSPWSVYKTSHVSSFQTNAAIFMKNPATGLDDNYVYFGDDSGNIYHMDGEVNGDNGDTDIQVFRRSRYFESDQIELEGIIGRVYYKRVADTDMTMQFEFGDDYSTTTSIVPLEGPPTTDTAAYWGGDSYWGGEFYWNSGFKFSKIMTTKGYSPAGKGTGIHMLLTFNTRQTFDVVKITDEP